jgi:anti-sigma factor RsiW
MSDPSCRTYRELLGVYVVGAIEPGERALVDAHLSQCYECREELAGLARLTALMHRVPAAEAERIALAGATDDGSAQPSAEVLNSLLKQVGARRRTRRLRAMFTTAAAIVLTVGAAVAATEALNSHPHHFEVATVSRVTPRGTLGATVRYGGTTWGTTTVSVRVTGFPEWTECKFWVITKDGRRDLVGGWTVGPGSKKLWYPIEAEVPKSSVASFVITWGNRSLRIPTT